MPAQELGFQKFIFEVDLLHVLFKLFVRYDISFHSFLLSKTSILVFNNTHMLLSHAMAPLEQHLGLWQHPCLKHNSSLSDTWGFIENVELMSLFVEE